MNIGFLFTTLAEGGIGRVASVIMNALSRNDEYHIYAFLYAQSKKEDIYPLSDTIKRTYILDSHISMRNAIVKKRYINKLHNQLVKNDIDILIACGDLHFLSAVLASKFTKTKVICWDHTGPKINSDIKMQKITKDIFTSFSDYNLVLTKAALAYYNKRKNRKKNFQIYNPIDPLLLNDSTVYNTKSNKIISVGRICYQKNYDRLLDIATIVSKRHPDWKWDIYGDGPEKDRITSKCTSMGLDKFVSFKGNVPNLYDLYGKYSMIVMTSRYEGFPMTLLEASAKGLPMIAFDVETGPNEIIKNGKNGFLCNNDDTKCMVRSIELLINDENLRAEMSKKSIRTAQRFLEPKIVKQWESMFRIVVSDSYKKN